MRSRDTDVHENPGRCLPFSEEELHAIDETDRRHGVTRSGFLRRAIQRAINVLGQGNEKGGRSAALLISLPVL